MLGALQNHRKRVLTILGELGCSPELKIAPIRAPVHARPRPQQRLIQGWVNRAAQLCAQVHLFVNEFAHGQVAYAHPYQCGTVVAATSLTRKAPPIKSVGHRPKIPAIFRAHPMQRLQLLHDRLNAVLALPLERLKIVPKELGW
jgi:hypothetical protein